MQIFPRQSSKCVRVTAPAAPRSLAAVALALAWALLQSLGVGCAPRPSSFSALVAPGDVARPAFNPAIACDPGNHDVLLCWLAGDSARARIWFSRSADHGVTWSVPVAVSPQGESLLLEPESSPAIICDDAGRVGIAWSAWTETPAQTVRMTDLRFAHSLDHGATWGTPVTVSDDTTGSPSNQAFFDLALRPEGALFAAWLDSRPGSGAHLSEESGGRDASIWFARSDDFGGHWGPNAAHWPDVVPNCRVNLVVEPAGAVYAAFRKYYPGQVRDVVFARPGWPPVRTHADAWQVPDCPPSGPAMTVSRDGTLRLAWYTGATDRSGVWFRQILFESVDSTAAPVPVLVGNRLPTVHIGIAEGGMSGTLLALDADSTGSGQLTLARVEPSGSRVVERFVAPGTQGASYPSVATERGSRVAFVVWTDRSGGHPTLRLASWELGR